MLALLLANDLRQDDVDAVDVGFTQVETLLSDQAEAVVVFANNEPIQLANLGEEVNVIQVADYIDLVFNGIVTNEETIANNPELVEGFTRAMLRGLADTLADPDQAYEISKKYVEGLDDSRKEVLRSLFRVVGCGNAGLHGCRNPGSGRRRSCWQWVCWMTPVENLDAAYSNEFIEKVQP